MEDAWRRSAKRRFALWHHVCKATRKSGQKACKSISPNIYQICQNCYFKFKYQNKIKHFFIQGTCQKLTQGFVEVSALIQGHKCNNLGCFSVVLNRCLQESSKSNQTFKRLLLLLPRNKRGDRAYCTNSTVVAMFLRMRKTVFSGQCQNLIISFI